MALRPVPWSTTPCSICRISAAVSDETTRVPGPELNFDRAHIARLRQNVGHREHAMGLAVADADAINDDRSHLAIKHFIGPRDFLFQPGRDGHHLESRPRLVNVADGAVLQ